MLDYYDRLVTKGRPPPQDAIRTVAVSGAARYSDPGPVTNTVRGTAEGENMTLDDFLDPPDLYVLPVAGESKWQVWSKQRGGTGFFILPKDLAAMTDRKSSEREEDAAKLHSDKKEERKEALATGQADASKNGRPAPGKRPTRINKAVAEKLRASFTERVAKDPTASERAEKQRAKEGGLRKRRGKRTDNAVSSFPRSLVPSVKVGGTTLIGK